ncbi:helicase and polymerase-containing protein TEBICHI isoform X2 [Cucurbita maxima]|uniref:Helicase and polymerase-containing protein TEBICHI isoform X2 n=1 Tax=Cucurbita maxima TaxID=3661 RepID=A0A6J1KAV2_CUCMA|nr:helicase and polymerase-containing protein TEBICHI isoform X2 [Cucurbita maxima]
MASGSPPSRIDQFYASKKRKPLTPSLKSGSYDKDGKRSLEGSPGTKGTLDNYLVTSQDLGNDNPSHSVRENLSGQDPVKRNLLLKINNSSRNEHEEPTLSRGHTSEATEGIKKRTLEDSYENRSSAVKSMASDWGVTPCMEKPELKQFAADFLSLYCSELQTTVSSPVEQKVTFKRHSSPSLLEGEAKLPKKLHLMAGPSNAKGETNSSSALSDGNKQSNFLVETGDTDNHHPVALKACLQKCNKAPISPYCLTECRTPGLSTANACFRETPKSGSSSFSPGEAFWKEAIVFADGLCAPSIDLTSYDAEGSNPVEGQSNTKKLLLPGEPTQKRLKGQIGGGSGGVRLGEPGASIVSLRSDLKELNREVSSLPVKHFDFSADDKNLVESTSPSCASNESKVHAYELNEQSDCRYTTHDSPPKHNEKICDRDSLTKEKIHETKVTSSVPIGTEAKLNIFSPSDSITSDTVVHELRASTVQDFKEGMTPSSSIRHKDWLDLSYWLPREICSIYKEKGITKLHPWQVECLNVDGVLQRRNLVYCASTSAGKSFVAEILMLRRVISTGKMALLVLPYVSICVEKAAHLDVLLEPLDKHVRSYYGNQGGGTLPKDTSVAVCTIEKANSLINRLLEEGRLSEIGIIVIDELHMVGDQTRGYLLELLLTKLRYAGGEGNSDSSSGESSGTSSGKSDPAHGIQIVGMSATMPNVAAVADWLQAALYHTDFRPVPLEEYIKVGNTIYNKSLDIVRTISKTANLGGKDPDHIVELCNEVVDEGHSVLIFCCSRKGCESTAKHVSKFLKKFSVKLHNENSEFADISSAIDALRRCPAGLDPILEETFPSGVAYHHAGLTVEEREIVETCYRKGLLRVLTATSTLAAGVNLPARRVIFRQPRIGRDFIDGTRYKQMAGRAGRTGIDTKGESVLICRPEEIKRINELLNESCPPLQSCLSEDKNGMTHAILEVVAGGIVQTATDIHRYVRCTLLNSTKPFQDVVKSAQESLRWLCHGKFLEWNGDTKLYSTTPLGRASFGSSLSPEESLIVLDDLSRAREGFVLASDLHLVYLVTPINVDVEPDWELYYERFMGLSSLDQSVGNRVGVTEPFLMHMAHGAPVRRANLSRNGVKGLHTKRDEHGCMYGDRPSEEQTIRVCKRFYVALILSRLVQETPIPEVCEAFKVARGMVQALQESAGRFASMVSVFCERLGWHDLEGLVAKFQNRVSFGVRAEIVELTSIPFVKGSRARAFYKAGLRTPLAIAEASDAEIVKALFESASWTAEESTAQKRMHVGIARKIKLGARKVVLDKAEEARIAAFSAFKSLGFIVPQISRPLSASAVGNIRAQVAAIVPSEIDTFNRVVSTTQMEHVSTKSCVGGTSSSEKIGGKNLSETGAISVEAKRPTFGVENTMVKVEGSAIQEANSVVDCARKVDVVIANQVEKINDKDAQREQCSIKVLHPPKRDGLSMKGPIHAVSTSGGFESFLDLWGATQAFYFDLYYTKRSEVNSVVPFELHGIAICWENSPVYYLNLPKDLLWPKTGKGCYPDDSTPGDQLDVSQYEHWFEILEKRWKKINEIFVKENVRKFAWNLKVQIQVLKCPGVSVQKLGLLNSARRNMDHKLVDGSYLLLSSVHISNGIDMCIVAWILWPDDERNSTSNLEKEVKKRLSSEAAAAANRSGQWKNQMRRVAHNGCCRRAAQTRALCSVLWKLIISEELLEALNKIEIPLVSILADMETWGIGVDMEGCIRARNLLGKKLRCLEKEAYRLSGMTFSLYAAADIANVLYGHLKLSIPERFNKGKQHPSTDKQCLDLLRNEHPIVPVIKEHRTLAKLFNCTLGSICSLAKLSARTQKYTLHGHWLQTSTATGRLSMEEPNLQCVEHAVDFKMNEDDVDHCKINARDFFISTQENWLLLSADYSQIELRLMAHFSKDPSLIELLSKPHGDVFTMIAARWTGKTEDSIGSHERDQTKRLVYGILYGMGAKSLALQLECSRDEAVEKIQSFKSSFPGVASWLHEAVAFCRQKGYVETLKGRRRFLSKINSTNSKEKSKAQRQAVNSICQGSAADIIKLAMINLYSVIRSDAPDLTESPAANNNILRGHCRIVLQVHDELVLEVDPSVVKEAAALLQKSMENAASLLVPLQVKLKVGRTWGSLEPFLLDHFKIDDLVTGS